MKWKNALRIYILVGVGCLFPACQNEQLSEALPFAFVQKLIDLNNVAYQPLRFDRGFVYETGGVRGLIIYRRSANSFLALDRVCTFQPSHPCSVVEVEPTGLFMRCPCCLSSFDFEGNPLGGPARFPLIRYRTMLNGSLLSITN
ncbi:MAG: hypothetical protein RMJ44_03555 [Cytophagales bacterium]|nr:hypothetical protein [Bernardetiaceae bacterium]MDW8210141.1 hypothetical protein [Cytophagales bacterium]